MEAIRIRTDQAIAGMVVTSDVYSDNNQLIIARGTTLDDRMITKLRFYNIYGLYVYPPDSDIEILKEESYIETLRSSEDFKKFNRNYVKMVDHVHENFEEVIQGESDFDIDRLLADTYQLIEEGRNGIHLFEMLHGIREYDDISYVHSLNVSLICNIFAGWLKFDKEETKILTLSGLLHDIGKMLVPKDILTKAAKLNEAEYEIVKTHSFKGYQALKDAPIDVRVKFAALMHHERCDGSGYPNGFHGDQIADFAKIVAIADVYDAMTSNRRYRQAICPFDVVENFERDGFLKFDPKFLMVFLERIVESYLHTIVRLSDGREGEVVLINKLSLSRPVIRIGNHFVDLSREHNLMIDAII